MAPQKFIPHVSDFLVHLAQHHLGKIVGFDVAKGDESADPASLFTLVPHRIDASHSSFYLTQFHPTLLPRGQTFRLPPTSQTPAITTVSPILPFP